jgi:hypothetical protein
MASRVDHRAEIVERHHEHENRYQDRRPPQADGTSTPGTPASAATAPPARARSCPRLTPVCRTDTHTLAKLRQRPPSAERNSISRQRVPQALGGELLLMRSSSDETSGGRLVRDHERVGGGDPAGGDRAVAGLQARERVGLVGARDQPEYVRRALEYAVGERRPPSALVGAGDGYVPVGDLEHRVAGDQ